MKTALGKKECFTTNKTLPTFHPDVAWRFPPCQKITVLSYFSGYNLIFPLKNYVLSSFFAETSESKNFFLLLFPRTHLSRWFCFMPRRVKLHTLSVVEKSPSLESCVFSCSFLIEVQQHPWVGEILSRREKKNCERFMFLYINCEAIISINKTEILAEKEVV